MRTVNQYLGRKITMIVGLCFILLSAILFWYIFLLKEIFGISIQFVILLAAILLGIGITTAQITSSAFTSDLIGQNTVNIIDSLFIQTKTIFYRKVVHLFMERCRFWINWLMD
jgi:MFS family permease